MTDGNMGSFYTAAGGYMALAAAGVFVYYLSAKKANRREATAAVRGTRGPQNEPRKEDRKKKQRMESFASGAQEAAKAKAYVQAAEPEAAHPQTKPATRETPDDSVDNREFAKQLAKAQEGKKFASSGDNYKQKEKSVKQSRAGKLNNGESEEESPHVAVDAADDEQIEALSAEKQAFKEVLDKLEAATTGPSVLRITDSDKVRERENRSKVAKAPEKTETKKQRQNRKKAEAAKEARAEAEKERKALEEKQRRAARLAEGRPAKDGSQFTNAAVANTAWTNGTTNGTGPKPITGDNSLHQPLDTFESAAATKQQPAPVAAEPAAVKSEDSWVSSLPSEEEQLEMIKNDEWSTVPTKSAKKSAKKSNDSGEEASTKPLPAIAQPSKVQPPTSKPAKAAANAFSALTNDDTAEEVEEEWDV